MALIKTVETPHGIEASYHKIIKIEYDINNRMLVIIVAMYASEAARNAGRDVIWHEYVKVPFDHMTEDPRVVFYNILAGYGDSYLNGAVRDSRVEHTEEPASPEVVVDDGTHVLGDALYNA